MAYITVDEENSSEIKLYYEDHGSGQPILLIHGFPMSGAAWEKQMLVLLKAGYRVITYDRRGFGKSSQPSFGYDYDTFAADLNVIIRKFDLRDVILVGHSMGTGEITRYLGTFGSERVAGAVLVSPIPPFLLKTDDNPEGIDQSVFDVSLQGMKDDRPAFLKQFFADFYNIDETLGKQVSKEVIQSNWNIAVDASPKGTIDSLSAGLTDFREDLPKIDIPVLIIQGDADRILPFPVTGERLVNELKESRLVILKGAPHGILWTHAEDINRELMRFLADISQKGSQSWAPPGFS